MEELKGCVIIMDAGSIFQQIWLNQFIENCFLKDYVQCLEKFKLCCDLSKWFLIAYSLYQS